MSEATDAHSGTTTVREGFRFDLDALALWMRETIADFRGALTVEQFAGGQSNPTYKLITPDRSYVLRRKPPGKILKGAHAIEREARVLSALAKVDFPVPRVHGLCTDERVLGTWFYVMDMVEGRIFWDASVPGVSRTDRAMIFDSMNETIALLHSVDHDAIGLGDYGRPGNYFDRQIARWSLQYREDVEAGRDANMDRLIEWLEENMPDGDETSLVHGDFRIDNLIFHPYEPRVIAVLDWELSTLGNPLADFSYHAMMYNMPPHIVAGLGACDTAARCIPDKAAYIAAYCRRTGRAGIEHYAFYQAFAFFRLAAIFHGIKGRVIRGTAASSQAEERAKSFATLAQIGFELTYNS